jgi:hypothetical protein
MTLETAVDGARKEAWEKSEEFNSADTYAVTQTDSEKSGVGRQRPQHSY